MSLYGGESNESKQKDKWPPPWPLTNPESVTKYVFIPRSCSIPLLAGTSRFKYLGSRFLPQTSNNQCPLRTVKFRVPRQFFFLQKFRRFLVSLFSCSAETKLETKIEQGKLSSRHRPRRREKKVRFKRASRGMSLANTFTFSSKRLFFHLFAESATHRFLAKLLDLFAIVLLFPRPMFC